MTKALTNDPELSSKFRKNVINARLSDYTKLEVNEPVNVERSTKFNNNHQLVEGDPISMAKVPKLITMSKLSKSKDPRLIDKDPISIAKDPESTKAPEIISNCSEEVVIKGHFFSDHSATNRPDAKMQLSLIFFRISF